MEYNNLYILDIVELIINGLTALATICAVVFGIIYFNKRLKIYTFKDNDFLKLVAFDKGNGSCHFERYILNTNKMENPLYEDSPEKNEISINLALYPHCSRISLIIYDNFGRKYQYKYKIRRDKDGK